MMLKIITISMTCLLWTSVLSPVVADTPFSFPTVSSVNQQSDYLRKFQASLSRVIRRLDKQEEQLMTEVIESIMGPIIHDHVSRVQGGRMTKEDVKFISAKAVAKALDRKTPREVFNVHLKNIYSKEKRHLELLTLTQCNVHRKYLALKEGQAEFENCEGDNGSLYQYQGKDDALAFGKRSNKLFIQLKGLRKKVDTICAVSDLCKE
jgi:hypothetical protein